MCRVLPTEWFGHEPALLMEHAAWGTLGPILHLDPVHKGLSRTPQQAQPYMTGHAVLIWYQRHDVAGVDPKV